jgi:hypothetical protein
VKESRIENKDESQWAEHKASFTCERAELDTRFMYLIRQPIVILARNKPASNNWRHDQNRKDKSKNYPKKEKTKTN